MLITRLIRKADVKVWEAALLISLCVTLCLGVWAQSRQSALSSKLIRLHVIAQSDNEHDQTIKLEVRDAVLELLAPRLGNAANTKAAELIIQNSAADIESTAEKISGLPASVSLGGESYPTRSYEGFSLPAGKYTSLRVVLGEGKGRNWWCVVYPPICTSDVSQAEETGLLDGEDTALITENSGGYAVKFRVVELWGEVCRWAEGLAD